MYLIVTRVTSDVGVPSTYLVASMLNSKLFDSDISKVYSIHHSLGLNSRNMLIHKQFDRSDAFERNAILFEMIS